MGIVFEESFVGNKVDQKTHRIIPFSINKEVDEVKVCFTFDPYLVKGQDDLREAFKDGIFNYEVSKEEIEAKIKEGNMHLNNMISISIYKDGNFLGCSHKHNKNQIHTINKIESSYGFKKVKNTCGNYEVIVSFHGIFVDGMKLNLRVEI